MKMFFVTALTVMIGLSLVAGVITRDSGDHGRTRLVWMSDENPTREQQVDLFNKTNPKYNLELDPNNGGIEKVIVQSIAGVGPDLLDCHSPFELSACVKAGIAWDITDELKKLGIDPLRQSWSVGAPFLVYKGRVYGFLDNAAADGIWFNKDLFDQAGLPYPKGSWTWDQFLPVAEKLTIRDAHGHAKQYGLMMDWSIWQTFMMQWGGRLFTPDGTKCIVDSPEAVQGIQLMQDLVYKYKVTPSPSEEDAMASAGGWGAGCINQFGGGRGAMAVGGRWWLCSLRNFKGLKLGSTECPHGPRRIWFGYGRSTLINKNSRKRREALAFLKYLASPQFNRLVSDQADGLPPVTATCSNEWFLHNPKHPEEDFHGVWRDIMANASSVADSPFVNGQVVSRIMKKQMDLVKSGQRTAAQAMKSAAVQINDEIKRNLEEDLSLKAQYDSLVRRRK